MLFQNLFNRCFYEVLSRRQIKVWKLVVDLYIASNMRQNQCITEYMTKGNTKIVQDQEDILMARRF